MYPLSRRCWCGVLTDPDRTALHPGTCRCRLYFMPRTAAEVRVLLVPERFSCQHSYTSSTSHSALRQSQPQILNRTMANIILNDATGYDAATLNFHLEMDDGQGSIRWRIGKKVVQHLMTSCRVPSSRGLGLRRWEVGRLCP